MNYRTDLEILLKNLKILLNKFDEEEGATCPGISSLS